MTIETSRGAVAPAPKKNLPYRTLRAIDNALHLAGLGRGPRLTFAEIARHISQANPFETVFAFKRKIAKKIGAGERTVFRHIAELRELQLLEVLPQERKAYEGKFGVARLRLTRHAAELLGLAEPAAVEGIEPAELAAAEGLELAESAPLVDNPPAKMACGLNNDLSVPTISKNQPTPGSGGIPADLQCLRRRGVSRWGIFALMRKASSRGQRLSDIVAAKGEALRERTGGRLFGYLASLASGSTCFKLAAADARRQLEQAEQARALEGKAARFRARFAGQALTDRAQGVLHVFDSACRIVETSSARGSGSAWLHDLAPWIEAVEAGRLVLATAELEARFAGAAR